MTENVVHTVLGPVRPDELGVVLPHEHVFFDLSARFTPPRGERCSAGYEPVALGNVGRIRFAQRSNLDNLVLDDIKTAVVEFAAFSAAGGGTIVDLSPASNGRDVAALVKVSSATGVHAVAGTGYYVDEFLTDDVCADRVDELVEVMVGELDHGIGQTGVRAGIIGEVGCSWPLTDRERASLTAAAVAQQQTGAAISVHPGRSADAPAEIVEVLRAAGADLDRVVIGHLDRTFADVGGILTLAQAGTYLEFDLFGQESSHIRYGDVELPTDAARLRMIATVVEHGFADRVLMSHDIALKHHLESYGGHGYAHLQRLVVPRMSELGFSEAVIDQITRTNPARLLARKP